MGKLRNKETARAIFEEVINNDNSSLMHGVFSKSFSWPNHDLQGIKAFGPKKSGPALFGKIVNWHKRLFPDLRFEVLAQEVTGNIVATSWSASGTNRGSLLGSVPSFERVEARGVFLTHFLQNKIIRADGKWQIISSVGGGRLYNKSKSTLKKNSIDLRIIGPREGVPLLLASIPQLPSWEMFRSQSSLISQKRPVISMQLLVTEYTNEGRAIPRKHSLKDESKCLVRALKEFRVTKGLDVMGASAGGSLALDFALDNKDKVRSLVLIEPSAFWVLANDVVANKDAEEFLTKIKNEYSGIISPRQLEKYLVGRVLLPDGMPRKHPKWPTFLATRQALTFYNRLYSQNNNIEKLKNFRKPVLLVKGKSSFSYYLKIVDRLSQFLPICQVLEVEGGHSGAFGEGKKKFNETLLKFYDSLSVNE